MARQSRTSEGRGAQSRRAEERPARKSRYQGRTYVNPDRIPKGTTYAWLAETARTRRSQPHRAQHVQQAPPTSTQTPLLSALCVSPGT